MHKKESFSSGDGEMRTPSKSSWYVAGEILGKAVRKLVCAAILLAILAFIGKHGYAFAYELYHAKDLPCTSIFTPKPILYTEDNLPDHPALNVVQDNPDYDEQHFMRIYDVTPDVDGNEPEKPEYVSEHYFDPEPGHTYEVQIYCRNGADPQYNTNGYGCADAVYVQVNIPHKFTRKTWARKIGSDYVVYDFITVDIAADNIYPVAASDWVEFYSPDDLRFDYVEGSAVYYDYDYPDGRAVNSKWLFEPGGALVNISMYGGREYAWMVKFRFEVSKTKWYPWDALIYDFQN